MNLAIFRSGLPFGAKVDRKDLLLAAGLALGVGVENLEAGVWLAALGSITALSLALRRRAPLVMVGVIGTFFVLGEELAPTTAEEGSFLFSVALLLLAIYSVAAYEPHLIRAVLGGSALLVSANWDLVVHGLSADDFWPFRLLFLGGAWALGRVAHEGVLRVGELTDETQRLKKEHEARAREAVLQERARLARELHDVIAHNVSVMVVQAGAAEKVLPQQGGQAVSPVKAIQETGRQTIVELRRLLGILRAGDKELLTAPQPSLSQLGALVDKVRSSGLDLQVDIQRSDGLPTSLDLSAYRIIQEALTNVMKHAQATEARVKVFRTSSALRIEVSDNGRGYAGNGHHGFGLLGIKERVDLFEGSLTYGGGEHRGFSLTVELPLELEVNT
jgi:signal transduction histidine kinase